MPLVMARAMISAATPSRNAGDGNRGDHAYHGLPPLGLQVPRRHKELKSHDAYCSWAGITVLATPTLS